jgi:hypothetical protein
VPVTEAEIRTVMILPQVSAGTDVLADITAASDFADLITTESLGDAGLSTVRLQMIRKFLAAHYLTLKWERGGLERYKVGESEHRYQPQKFDPGLGATRYGQTAITLDPSGQLATLAEPVRQAQFRVI